MGAYFSKIHHNGPPNGDICNLNSGCEEGVMILSEDMVSSFSLKCKHCGATVFLTRVEDIKEKLDRINNIIGTI